MHTFRPVEVRPQAGISAGAMLWRYRGELHLTAIVKATFSIAPDGSMALAAPEELVPADVHLDDDPRRSLLRASDRVPFRPQADVVLTGSAHPAGGRGQRALARLGVRRDRVLVDKTIHVVGDRTATLWFSHVPLVYERAFGGAGRPDNPVGSQAPNLLDPRGEGHPIGFGPLAASWPLRERLFGSGSRAALDAPIPEIPADIDWAFFQAAPVDQRIDFLAGDEWILLEGLHPQAERITARLPGVRAEGMVQGPLSPGCPDTQPLELDADGLAIDADRLACTVTWRVAMPVANERDLAKIRLSLGIVLGQQPAASPVVRPPPAPSIEGAKATTTQAPEPARGAPPPRKPFPVATDGKVAEPVFARPQAPAPSRPQAPSFEGTMDLTAARAAGVVAVAPFRIAPAGPSKPAAASTEATPWGAVRIAPAPRPGADFEGTLDLTPRPAPEPEPPSPDLPPKPDGS